MLTDQKVSLGASSIPKQPFFIYFFQYCTWYDYSQIIIITECPLGQIVVSGKCQKCPVDKIPNNDGVTCDACPDGEVPYTNGAFCTPCAVGQIEATPGLRYYYY